LWIVTLRRRPRSRNWWSPPAPRSRSARWQITPHIELFGQVDNVGDHRYATFGAFSPTDSVPIAEAPGAANPRSLAPGAPRQFAVGVRAKF
jgi:iron complex outermembrane receptor protein